MEPTVLYTIIGLLVAIYAIIPAESKLDLRVRFNWLDISILIVALLLVHYILFFPVLYNLGIVKPLGNWKWGFNPNNTSYLIILSATVFLFIRYTRARLRKNKISVFQKLSESLLQENKFSELLFLIEKNYKRLFKIYKADFLLNRLKKKLTLDPIFQIDFSAFGLPSNQINDDESSITWIEKSKRTVLSSIQDYLIYIPAGERESRIAEKIISRVLLSNKFNGHLSRINPTICLKILDFKFRERKKFQALFVKNLLKDRSSIIYFEIYYSQEMTGIYRYKLDEHNPFLFYFLNDANKANELAIYKPFGDSFLEYLDELHLSNKTDKYNQPILNYFEEDRWDCPLHTIIRFFEIMVIEALYQNIEWHMWLYYFPSFVTKILRNLDPDPTVDLSREWPTPYHYLLYELLSVLRNFVRAIEEIPVDQENIVLDNERVDHENDNIPKSAILAIGLIVKDIIMTDKLEDRFKSYLIKTVLRLLSELNTKEKLPYRRVLEKSILSGGFNIGQNNQVYHQNLKLILNGVDDIILRSEMNDFLKDH